MIKSPRSFAIVVFCIFAAVLLAGGGVFYIERVNTNRERYALTDAQMLGFAAEQYMQDHNNCYPDAGRWEQEIMPYLDTNAETIIHPAAPYAGTPRRFSLNPALSGKPMAAIASPSNVWMFYESVSTKPSASDNLDFFPSHDKNGGDEYAVVWGDGHCYLRGADWKNGVLKHLPGF